MMWECEDCGAEFKYPNTGSDDCGVEIPICPDCKSEYIEEIEE